MLFNAGVRTFISPIITYVYKLIRVKTLKYPANTETLLNKDSKPCIAQNVHRHPGPKFEFQQEAGGYQCVHVRKGRCLKGHEQRKGGPRELLHHRPQSAFSHEEEYTPAVGGIFREYQVVLLQ